MSASYPTVLRVSLYVIDLMKLSLFSVVEEKIGYTGKITKMEEWDYIDDYMEFLFAFFVKSFKKHIEDNV